ncbi:MAG: hypothetical protein KIT68_08050 [Phycisphaeraceae bacterium]|nr:hypothetical protein [Phycisphaeraceae bacterium]
MNWIGAAIVGYVLLALELAIRAPLSLGPTGIAPYVLLPLVVHIAMHAPSTPSLWAGLIAGLAVDLESARPTSDGLGTVVVLGPCALGYLLSVFFTLNVRSIVIRRNPLSFVAVCIVAALLGQVATTLVFTLRQALDPSVAFSPGQELWIRSMSSLATGLSAAVLSYPLRWLNPALGLQDPTLRRFRRPGR